MSVLSRAVISLIEFYQRNISPAFPRRCRYYPTCSAYAVEALRVHGLFKGLLLATARLLRCNPWSLGGVNHIPPRGKWRGPTWEPPNDWAGFDTPEEPKRGLFWHCRDHKDPPG